jgi:hypothetical protein
LVNQGFGIIVQGTGYDVTEISTPYIVGQIQSYETVSDAIGFCFQLEDHSFYAIVFPTANAAWLYDLGTKQWCEWGVLDADGNLDRPRSNCCMFAFGKVLTGDFETGSIYQLSGTVYTDNGNPIYRLRTFAHMLEEGDRITYKSFTAYMQVGTANPPSPDVDFPVFLRWSDDGGITFSNAVQQSLGKGGQFKTQPQWNRLGMARDRVFELTWSAPFNTALAGAWIDYEKFNS